MQITIVQSEIELAITNHIKELITVKEGMVIDIDLRATRGAEGFQAVIDIRPEEPKGRGRGGNTPSPAPSPSPAPAAAKPLGIEEKVTGGRGRAKKADETPSPEPKAETKVPETPKAEDPPFTPDTPAEEGKAAFEETKPAARAPALFAKKEAPANEDTIVAETVEQPESKPVASIFGGLKRPVNTDA